MKSLHKLVIGAFLVAGTGTLIYAGPDDPTGTDSTTVPGAKVGVMTPSDMAVAGAQLMDVMEGNLRHVTQLRDKAAAEKDILRLNCVNDRLMPLKAEVNVADATKRQLDSTIGASDEQGRYAAYAGLTLSSDKVKDLRDEADACVGDALTYVGKTDVQVSGPENPIVPPDNGFGEGIEPPVYKTPFD